MRQHAGVGVRGTWGGFRVSGDTNQFLFEIRATGRIISAVGEVPVSHGK